MRLAKRSAKSGEPMVRHMEYGFPHEGFVDCKDQFLLGDKIMVAPILNKAVTRQVTFPKGKWKSESGKIISGPAVETFNVALDELLWFEKIN
jgi:alpha-glucosidase